MARRRKEERWGARITRHGEAMGSLLLPCAPRGLSLSTRGCLLGAPPRGQPWTTAVTLPQGHHGRSARRMAVLSTFRAPARCRHVHCELLRRAWLDVTPIIPVTALPPKKLRRGIQEVYGKEALSQHEKNRAGTWSAGLEDSSLHDSTAHARLDRVRFLLEHNIERATPRQAPIGACLLSERDDQRRLYPGIACRRVSPSKKICVVSVA